MLKLIEYDDDFPIKLDVLTIDEYPWHIHNDLQIIYVMEGDIELKMTYERFHLVRDSMHLIHPSDVHGMKGLKENNLILILSFDMSYFLDYYEDLNTLVFTTRVRENITTYKDFLTIKSIFFSIVEELLKKKTDCRKNIANLTFSMIDTLYRSFRGFTVNAEKHTIEHKVPRDPVQIERISHVISYVYNNYPYKISLDDIAQSENLSKYYLSHLFQSIVGISFRDFVSIVRVEISEFELLTSQTSIAQISENVGFSNAKYYVKNFENWFGKHPKMYRQLYKGAILGNQKIKVTERPISAVNTIIQSNQGAFGFKNSSTPVMRSSYHYYNSNSFKCEGSVISDMKKLYNDYSPHDECISIIKEYLIHHSASLDKPLVFDTTKRNDGFHTPNGMRKPLYWLYCFLNEQTDQGIQCGDYYCMSAYNNTVRILLFNESGSTQLFEFEFLEAFAEEYKITEHRLHDKKSCISYWQQLGFKSPLSESEIDHINHMSSPEISFRLIKSNGSFIYATPLDSKDIYYVEVQPL